MARQVDIVLKTFLQILNHHMKQMNGSNQIEALLSNISYYFPSLKFPRLFILVYLTQFLNFKHFWIDKYYILCQNYLSNIVGTTSTTRQFVSKFEMPEMQQLYQEKDL